MVSDKYHNMLHPDELEAKKSEEGLLEERRDTWWISAEYLSAAIAMVATQFIDDMDTHYGKDDEVKFLDRAEYVLRQHCPIAYAYFMQSIPSERVLPESTAQILLQRIWEQRPDFLGGPDDDRPKTHVPR